MKILFRAFLLAAIGFALLWFAGVFQGTWFDEQFKRIQYAAQSKTGDEDVVRETEIDENGDKIVRVYKAGKLIVEEGGSEEAQDLSNKIGTLIEDAISFVKRDGDEASSENTYQSTYVPPEEDAALGEQDVPEQRATAKQVPETPEDFADELSLQINSYRSEQGVGELDYDSSLQALALRHSELIDSNELPYEGGFAVRSDEAGRVICTENYAIDYATPAGLLAAWQGSALQNENLLKTQLTRFGVGVHDGVITVIVCK